MTDDVTVDNGTLTDYVVSADAATADGALVQRVKLAYSADGSTTHVAADADGLLVNLGANNDVTVTGTVTASDGGGSLSVDDGGSSLTVDGSVSISGSVAVTGTFYQATQPVSGTVTANAGSGPFPVSDNAGSLTVDAPVGTPVFVRLSDGSSAITTLPVSLASVPSHAVTNAGTFAVQDSEKIADNAAFTDGTTKVLPTGYIYDEVAGTALTENDIAAPRINVNRATVATIEDGTTRGRYATVSASNALKVDGSAVTQPVSDASGSLTVDAPVGTPVYVRLSDGASAITTLPVSLASVPSHAVTNAGTFAVQESGAALTALQLIDNLVLAEDLAHTTADPGVQALAVRKATPANLSGTDGDYEPLQVSAGRLWASATIDAALPAGTNAIGKLAANSGVDIGDVDVTSVPLPTTAATSSVSSVAGSATNVTLLSSSAGRKGFRAFNDSSSVCYVKYGTTATSSDYTVQLLPGAFLEENHYSGRVDGIWVTATGAMKLTELS